MIQITNEYRRAIEAIILVSDNPVASNVMAQLLEIPKKQVEEICDDLAKEYETDGRGFILAKVAGGYRFQTHPETSPYIERFVLEGQNARLSAAALETLAQELVAKLAALLQSGLHCCKAGCIVAQPPALLQPCIVATIYCVHLGVRVCMCTRM